MAQSNKEAVEKTDEARPKVGGLLLKFAGGSGGLASLAALFSLIVAFSFVRSSEIDGLSVLTGESFKHAGLDFLTDLFNTLGKPLNLLMFLASLAFFLMLAASSKLAGEQNTWHKQSARPDDMLQQQNELQKQRIRRLVVLAPAFVLLAATAAAIYATLALGDIRGPNCGIVRKCVMYLVSVPGFIGLAAYVSFHIRDLEGMREWWTNIHVVFLLLFLIMMAIFIPLGYGSHIYDVRIHSVDNIKYNSNGYKSSSYEEGDLLLRIHDAIDSEDQVCYQIGSYESNKRVVFLIVDRLSTLMIVTLEPNIVIGTAVRLQVGSPVTLRWVMQIARENGSSESVGDSIDRERILEEFFRPEKGSQGPGYDTS